MQPHMLFASRFLNNCLGVLKIFIVCSAFVPQGFFTPRIIVLAALNVDASFFQHVLACRLMFNVRIAFEEDLCGKDCCWIEVFSGKCFHFIAVKFFQ
jgi:hypothetical protein